MAVLEGSRYAGLGHLGVVHGDGEVTKFLDARTPISPDAIAPGAQRVRFGFDEEMDLLVWRHGGPTRLWWVVADVNEVTELPLGKLPEQETAAPQDIGIGRREIVLPQRRLLQALS